MNGFTQVAIARLLFQVTWGGVGSLVVALASTQENSVVSKSDETTPLKIDNVALVLNGDAETLRAEGNIGGVIANRNHTIDFQVQNPFDFDIEFESSRSSSNCTEVKFQQLKIPGRGSVQGTITYLAPDFAKGGQIDFTIRLIRRPLGTVGPGGAQTVAMLNFTGYLRGVIDVGTASHVFEVQEKIDEYLIPIVITEPIKFEDLEIKASAELKDISVDIARTNEGGVVVKIVAAKNSLPPNGIAGEVIVSHRPSKLERILLLTVTPQLPVRISPSFLAFSTDSLDDRIVRATAIIRVNAQAESSTVDVEDGRLGHDDSGERSHEEGHESRSGKSRVRLEMSECKLGDFHLEHELIPLSDSVWKLRLSISSENYKKFVEAQKKQGDRDEESGRDVRFRIRTGQNGYERQIGLSQLVELSFADANSVTDQALAYGESITKGDVLVRQTALFESLEGDVDKKPPGIIRENTMFYRAVFDFEQDQFALYRLVDQKIDDLGEQLPGNVATRSLYAVCYNSKRSDQVTTSHFPGGPNRYSRSDFDKTAMVFLRGIGFRDCRYAFLGLDCHPLVDHHNLQLKRQQSGDTTVEVELPDDNSIEIITAKRDPNMPDGWKLIRLHQRERFDVKSGFRVFSGEEGAFEVNGIEKELNGNHTKLTLDWKKEIPVVVSGNSRVLRSLEHKGREYKAFENTRYDFFWISFNEAIEDSLFDQENIGSTNKILELLDPEKVGAKELLRLPDRQLHSKEDEDH